MKLTAQLYSSSWEYSNFAPHDTAHLIELMGGNVRQFCGGTDYRTNLSDLAIRTLI